MMKVDYKSQYNNPALYDAFVYGILCTQSMCFTTTFSIYDRHLLACTINSPSAWSALHFYRNLFKIAVP